MWVLGHAGFASVLFTAGARIFGTRWDPKARARAFRWFLLGSLLPDLLDKPMGRIILGEHFQNGRIFFHTILALFVTMAVGFLLWRSGDARLLALSSGMAVHLLLDGIWAYPEVALWPLLGPFPRFPEAGSFWEYLAEKFREPWVIATELSGAVALFLSLSALGYCSPKRLFWLVLPESRRKEA